MNPGDPHHCVNVRLAEYLGEHKKTIISEWLEQVRTDITRPGDMLSGLALKDHIPQLFEDLIETMRSYGNETVAQKSEDDAKIHGAVRWQQGFKLTDVLREISHLRGVLLYHLRIFEELNGDFGVLARLFVSTALHRFLDAMAIDATDQFLLEGSKAQNPVGDARTSEK